MIARIKELVAQAKCLPSDAEIRQAAIALIRILLQHACITLTETLIEERKLNTHPSTPLPLEKLRIPSDGTLVACLAELLVAAENIGRSGASRAFWQPVASSRACARLSKSSTSTVESILNGFVDLRNDSVEGHGIPGKFDSAAEIDAVEITLERLSSILPYEILPSGELVAFSGNKTPYTLKLLRAYGRDLICYRKITKSQGGRCSVRAQRQKSLFEREDVSYEAEDILGTPDRADFPRYEVKKAMGSEWSPLVLLPERITNHFTGREKELRELADWIDDTDSRACMLFGDGGIGKTTLAVEFVHRMLAGEISSDWRPDLITFFTAKQTRWGLNGLESIRAQEVGVVDAGLTIVRAFEGPTLSRDWFTKDAETVIQKVAGHLSEWGINRKQHLLILDNTETMAQNEEDIIALASQIQELSRRVGRVLLTSRRREAIEARPIEIKPLDEEEAVVFLRKRGEALQCRPIIQAGISTLKQYANKLGRKPLVLEVFIQAASVPEISLDKAFLRVMLMHAQDLGEFLYSDAWARMSNGVRHLLLLMTRVADLHDEMLMKLCCLQAEVTMIEASEALEESRGIASITTINGSRQITFTPEFLKFCEQRTVTINATDLPTKHSVDAVQRRYNEFLRSSSTRVYDRVQLAYRHAVARAAWLAYQEQRYEDCELFYEQAIISDNDNGWLFDRYAYFLFTQRRYAEALDKATRASNLLSEDPEVWFTRGMIEGRLGQLDAAIISLNRAIKYKKPRHLCALQIAYAHFYSPSPSNGKIREWLDESEQKVPKTDTYHYKHMAEIRTFRQRVSGN